MLRTALSKALLTLSLCLASHTSQAAYFFGYPIYPYLGVDYQYRSLPLRENFGDNAFKQEYNQLNLYVGARFWRYLGLELNYSQTQNRTNSGRFDGNNVVNGVFIPPGISESHQFQSKFSSFGGMIMGFLPVPFDRLCRGDILLGIGVSHGTPKFTDTITAINNTSLLGAPNYTFQESRGYLRLLAGFQYLFNHNVGLRTAIIWEDTAQLRNMSSTEVPHNPRRVGLKASWVYSFGIFFRTSAV